MNILNKFFNKADAEQSRSLADINAYFEKTGKNKNEIDDIQEITYYTCLKILSENIGKLSVNLKDGEGNKIRNHSALNCLKVRPNPYMSPATFKSLMEYNRNHYGNAYAWLKYNRRGELVGIYPLQTQNVKIIIDNANLTNKNVEC